MLVPKKYNETDANKSLAILLEKATPLDVLLDDHSAFHDFFNMLYNVA